MLSNGAMMQKTPLVLFSLDHGFGNVYVLQWVFVGSCLCMCLCLWVCLDAQTAMYNAYMSDLLMTKLFI